MKIIIALSSIRRTASFQKYIFRSTITFQFTLEVEGIFFLSSTLHSGIYISQEIPKELILLCMDYDVALRLEVTESQSNKQYHCKTLSGYSQSLTPRTLVPLAPVLFYIDFWDKNYIY